MDTHVATHANIPMNTRVDPPMETHVAVRVDSPMETRGSGLVKASNGLRDGLVLRTGTIPLVIPLGTHGSLSPMALGTHCPSSSEETRDGPVRDTSPNTTSEMGAAMKPKTPTRLSVAQRRLLLDFFRKDTFPSVESMRNVASKVGISLTSVRYWFQNTRARLRRADGKRKSLALDGVPLPLSRMGARRGIQGAPLKLLALDTLGLSDDPTLRDTRPKLPPMHVPNDVLLAQLWQ